MEHTLAGAGRVGGVATWSHHQGGGASQEGRVQQTLRERLGRGGLRGQPGAPRANSVRGRTPLLECKVAVRRVTLASLNGPARDKEQGRALSGTPRSAP